jgi:hypothetical protein
MAPYRFVGMATGPTGFDNASRGFLSSGGCPHGGAFWDRKVAIKLQALYVAGRV